MKKTTTIVAASICFAILLIGISCSKDQDLIINLQEHTQIEHDHEFHEGTRAGGTCNLCGARRSIVTGMCLFGCDDHRYVGPYHCKSCKSRNVNYPEPGYRGSCNICGSDPNWEGLQLCSETPCRMCGRVEPDPGAGTGAWLGPLFSRIGYEPEIVRMIFHEWMEDVGMLVMEYMLTYQEMLLLIVAIESGDITEIENAIVGGENGEVGKCLIMWLIDRGYY